MIEIRRAVKDDIPQIMEFIDTHWKKGHILGNNRVFFEWMYVLDDKVNMYIGVEDGRIVGFNGFIYYNHDEHPSVSGAMWKVIKTSNPILGLEISECMGNEIQNECFYEIGMNPKTALRIARLSGVEARKMNHYYRLAPKENYCLANVADNTILSVTGDTKLVLLKDYDLFCKVYNKQWFAKKRPYKEVEFFRWRYYEHPIYHYQVYGLQNRNSEIRAIMVLRKVECESSAMIKIVDFIGEDSELCLVGPAIDDILQSQNCEYIDMYSSGLSAEIMEAAGFIERYNTENIIPNYFEPFEQKNVDIYCGAPSMKNVYLYRGDGDQDRPSQW